MVVCAGCFCGRERQRASVRCDTCGRRGSKPIPWTTRCLLELPMWRTFQLFSAAPASADRKGNGAAQRPWLWVGEWKQALVLSSWSKIGWANLLYCVTRPQSKNKSSTLGLSLLFAESLWSIGCGSDRCVLCLSDVGPTGVCCACVQSILYIVYIG